MSVYGKTAQNAIAAISRLAEAYDARTPVLLSSGQIAADRDLPKPVVGQSVDRPVAGGSD
jgi:hypothetical protein